MSLLIGHGDGSFDPGILFPVGTAPQGGEVFDADDDGDLDYAVANRIYRDITPLLNVCAPPPTRITDQPNDVIVENGDGPATFVVGAEGENLTYQWLRDGVEVTDGGNVSGATTPMLRINPVRGEDTGRYSARVRGDHGEVLSEEARLGVLIACMADIDAADFFTFLDFFAAGCP